MYDRPPNYDSNFFVGDNGKYYQTSHSLESLRLLSRKTCKRCWGKGYYTVSLNRNNFWNHVCDCVSRKEYNEK